MIEVRAIKIKKVLKMNFLAGIHFFFQCRFLGSDVKIAPNVVKIVQHNSFVQYSWKKNLKSSRKSGKRFGPSWMSFSNHWFCTSQSIIMWKLDFFLQIGCPQKNQCDCVDYQNWKQICRGLCRSHRSSHYFMLSFISSKRHFCFCCSPCSVNAIKNPPIIWRHQRSAVKFWRTFRCSSLSIKMKTFELLSVYKALRPITGKLRCSALI